MYLLFDIGGSSTRLAISKNLKNLEPGVEKFPTPKNFADGMILFRNFVRKHELDGKLKAVAGGIAGQFDSSKTKLTYAPNLSGWVGKPLVSSLKQITHSPVFLENDAANAGLGEAHFGAGKGKKILAYLAVGTGFGGSRIVDGKVDANALGFEPGKQIIDLHNRKPVIVEDLFSGAALKKHYHKMAYQIKSRKTWNQLSLYLAVALNNLTILWSPDIIVLNGGVIRYSKLGLAHIRKHAQQLLQIKASLPAIALSKLGDEAGLWGGLVQIRQKQ